MARSARGHVLVGKAVQTSSGDAAGVRARAGFDPDRVLRAFARFVPPDRWTGMNATVDGGVAADACANRFHVLGCHGGVCGGAENYVWSVKR